MGAEKRTVALLGIGILTPGVKTISELAPYCSKAENSFSKQVETIPPPGKMNRRELRRMAHLTKLALYAADAAFRDANLQGQNSNLYVGLTHGTTSLLKEFHDFLFDFGPSMVSPNAFSNGVTNAPLGAISKLLGFTNGGCTLVGYEQCGMEILHMAADAIIHNTTEFCCAGAVEEYSPIVEGIYKQLNWYQGSLPDTLPHPCLKDRECKCFPTSEGSVFFSVSSKEYALKKSDIPKCFFTPISEIEEFSEEVDLVISDAGGGPQDNCELNTLLPIFSRQKAKPGILFSKAFFGETFAVSPLLSSAVAWDILVNKKEYPFFPVNKLLADKVGQVLDFSSVNSILIVAGSREGEVSAGILSRNA